MMSAILFSVIKQFLITLSVTLMEILKYFLAFLVLCFLFKAHCLAHKW
jgi:hypothetical protein